LNVQTRDGSRERIFSRTNVSATGFSATSEGPLGRAKKASFLVSGRKSYLDYVIDRITDEPTFVFSYKDLQGKLSFNPSDRHHLSVTALVGDSGLNRDRILDRLSINGLRDGNSQTQIYTARWRWLLSTTTLLQSSIFLSKENARNSNRTGETLFDFNLKHFGVRQDFSIELSSGHRLEAGHFVRRMEERATRRRFDFNANQFRPTSQFTASGMQPGGYVQDTWSMASNRIALTGGIRLDHFGPSAETVILPRSSLSIAITPGTHVTAAYGQFTQFPTLSDLRGEFRNPDLRAERASHYSIGIERLLTEKTRFRVEAYDLEVKERIFSPETEWRLSGNRITPPRPGVVLANSLRGNSRGVELFIQRRSANRLSGWISYSYGVTRLHDTRSGLRFDSDYDQRHTFNTYGSYRLSETLNVSSKYRYGSGFPIAGFYRPAGEELFIAEQRNLARAPAYSRWDVRINKAFFFSRWKLTLYGEVVNVLNRKHIVYTDLESINSSTGKVFLDYNTLLPVVPTAGVTIEF
jgi:outer membrane receptor for ferrienterochelin and colicin